MKLIVSIQKYTLSTTQELANLAIEGGAIGIRTDRNIKIKGLFIGLIKDYNFDYYITPTIAYINQVSEWGGLVAIDCRKGNKNLAKSLNYCQTAGINYIADIETFEDFGNVYNYKPEMIATTFSFFETGMPNVELIRNIRTYSDIPIIAEGGYEQLDLLDKAKIYGADYACIGGAISGIKSLTEAFCEYVK